MSQEVRLTVQPRTRRGTAECRRLRRNGRTPGNVYGLDADPIAISVETDEFLHMVHSGARVLDFHVEGRDEKAILRDIQWDTFGVEIQHFDLMRVDPKQQIEVEVPVELRGVSPGVVGGGLLDQHLHTITVRCLPFRIPDSIQIKMGGLDIGDSVHIRDLTPPEGCTFVNEEDELVLQVIEAATVEELLGEEVEEEPELVGEAAEEGEAAESAEEESGEE